tara:strand:+ start:836 stop:1000 length:165 start_codon:yes stop_codon:yes gene_type:complete
MLNIIKLNVDKLPEVGIGDANVPVGLLNLHQPVKLGHVENAELAQSLLGAFELR